MVYRLHICWAFCFFDESFMCFAILHMVLTHINAVPPSLTIPVKARILCISLNFIELGFRGCPQAICSEHKNTKTDLSRSKKAPKYSTPTTGAKEGQKQDMYLSRLSASTKIMKIKPPTKPPTSHEMKIGPVPVVGLARRPYGKGPQRSGGHAGFKRFFMGV